MGVWNATCTVSHLPILENEPCTGFLITFGNKTGDTCYPDDRFCVLSPAIHGLYNGYGSLQNIQNPESLLKTIQRNASSRTTAPAAVWKIFFEMPQMVNSDYQPNGAVPSPPEIRSFSLS